MAESGPIKYEELFAPDLDTRMTDLVSKINEVKKAFDDMSTDIKSKAQGLSDALSGSSSATKGGRDNTQAQAAQADALYASYQQLKDATEYLNKNLVALNKTEEANKKVVDALKTSNDNFAGVLERVKSEAELASEAIAKLGGSGNTAEVKQLTATVKALDGQVRNLEKALNSQTSANNNAGKSTSGHKKELLSLYEAYSTLSPLIEKTGVDLYAIISTEKQHQQVSKNGEIANNSLAGSYNQLAAQYNLLKTALNAMSVEMRSNTAVGKEWEAEALRIMNEMKAMQEATGKSTLSVGNYEKAFNGLNIATQQVLREMPTLANSVQQFFIAISNNVPIFIDNFKRASAELGGFTKAVGATVKAMFSWQTLLLVILTILPRVAKAIHDKKKAQEEANKATEKAITLDQMFAEVNLNVEKAIGSSAMRMEFLTGVIEDNTRSIEDRTAASRILKQEFEDELANFTEEEIVAGRAKDALDQLTQSIKTQAEARAMLNKMVEYYGKILDNEANIAEAQSAYEVAVAQREAAEATWDRISQINNLGEGYTHYAEAMETARTKEREALKALNDAKKLTEDYGAVIDDLYNRLPIEGLAEKTEKASRRVRAAIEKALDIPDYYFEMLQSIVNLTEDELDRELQQFDLNNEILKAKRLEQADELENLEEELQSRIANTKDKARKAEYEAELAYVREQMENLNKMRLNEELAYQTARDAMVQEHAEKRLDIQRKAVQTAVAAEKTLRNKAAYEEYERGMNALDQTKDNTAEEIRLKEELNKALLESEKKYWFDYLKQLREEHLLTEEEYVKIMDKIAGFNTAKATETSTPSRRKRGQKQFRNVTEIGFALSPTFGEDVFNEKGEKIGRKIKDEYLDFASAVNDAIQTSIDYMDEWMDKRIEMAELAVEKAREEAEEAKTALDYESEARANGYANNVELARKEYAEKKRMEQEAIAEQKRLQKIQEEINTSQQIGALVTATANLWSGYSEIPIVGPALAIAATALMWGSFIAAKVQAAQVARYGEGMAEYLDYGGSHASGHDIDFGRTKDGKQRRVERGEVVGVIRKDKVQKYGVDKVLDIINSLNNGTYNDRVMSSDELLSNVFGETPESAANLAYLRAKVGDMLGGGESLSMGLKTPITANSGIDYSSAFEGARALTDLSVLERGVGELIKQGELRVVQTAEGRIEYRGNNKRIIRNG